MNLFVSFACNNSLWLLWYGVVLGNPQVIEENEVRFLLLLLLLTIILLLMTHVNTISLSFPPIRADVWPST